MPLRSDKVPVEVRVLLPLAERWDIGDDIYREAAVAAASLAQLQELVATLDGEAGDFLYNWLGGPEADSPRPTKEYLALTHLTMAADSARLKLKRRQSQS